MKLREWGIPIRDFAADATGNQGAQVDRIEQEMGQRGACRVFFSGPSTERPVSASGHTARQHYNDHATELLANFAAIVRQGRMRGITDAIAHQVATRRTLKQNGRMKAEEKDDWKARNQDRSPDDLDSAVCAVELAIRRKLIRPYIDARALPTVRAEESFFLPSTRRGNYLERLRRAARVAWR